MLLRTLCVYKLRYAMPSDLNQTLFLSDYLECAQAVLRNAYYRLKLAHP